MIILKIIVFIWTVCSIYISGIWFVVYAVDRARGLGKSHLLVTHLIAPYFVVRISIKDVITIIKKRRLKRNGNNV